MSLKELIRTIPDFPKSGIMFRDCSTLYSSPSGLKQLLDLATKSVKSNSIDKIAAIEARGFILGSLLAKELNLPLILLRKPGKLPGKTISMNYDLEYGSATLELQESDIKKNERVLLVDDLIATGGTAFAGASLIQKLGGKVIQSLFIINLPELKGSERIKEFNPVWLVEYAGH